MGSVLGDRSSGHSRLLPSLLSIVLETSLRHASTVHPSTRPSTHKPTHRPPIHGLSNHLPVRPPAHAALQPFIRAFLVYLPRHTGKVITECRDTLGCVLTAAGTLGPGSLVSRGGPHGTPVASVAGASSRFLNFPVLRYKAGDVPIPPSLSRGRAGCALPGPRH